MAHKAMDPAAELYDYLIAKTGTMHMQHGQSSKSNASTSGVHGIHGITGRAGKSAPQKKLILLSTTNDKFVRKLVFLHNNLTQYYNISYQEVMIVYDKAIFVMIDPTPLIYFEPTVDMDLFKTNEEPHLYNIYRMLDKYLTTGLITPLDMQYANTVWLWLKEKAGITTP